MKPLKHLYLYFQDGQRLALRFPKQSEDPAAVARALRKQLLQRCGCDPVLAVAVAAAVAICIAALIWALLG